MRSGIEPRPPATTATTTTAAATTTNSLVLLLPLMVFAAMAKSIVTAGNTVITSAVSANAIYNAMLNPSSSAGWGLL